jgi:hypothetical protein
MIAMGLAACTFCLCIIIDKFGLASSNLDEKLQNIANFGRPRKVGAMRSDGIGITTNGHATKGRKSDNSVQYPQNFNAKYAMKIPKRQSVLKDEGFSEEEPPATSSEDAADRSDRVATVQQNAILNNYYWVRICKLLFFVTLYAGVDFDLLALLYCCISLSCPKRLLNGR